jgi:hypothetical protein
MRFRANIDVIFDIPDRNQNPKMVAELWAGGIVEGIRFNKPEVKHVDVMVMLLMDPVAEDEAAIEATPQAPRPELERGE